MRTTKLLLTVFQKVYIETFSCLERSTCKWPVVIKPLLMLTSNWETIEELLISKRKLTRYWSRSCPLMTSTLRHQRHKCISLCSSLYLLRRQKVQISLLDLSDQISQLSSQRVNKRARLNKAKK